MPSQLRQAPGKGQVPSKYGASKGAVITACLASPTLNSSAAAAPTPPSTLSSPTATTPAHHCLLHPRL